MRGLNALTALLVLSACAPQPAPPRVTVNGETITCDAERMRTDDATLSSLRIIANAQPHTTDPAKLAEIERLRADARRQVARLAPIVAECDAAIMVQ